MFALTEAFAVTGAGTVMIILAVVEQPLLSETVTVYEPAERLLAVAFEPPLGDHAYVYGEVPPPGVTVALPVLAHSDVLLFTEAFAVKIFG